MSAEIEDDRFEAITRILVQAMQKDLVQYKHFEKRISILIIKNLMKNLDCSDIHHLFSDDGKILRIVYNLNGAERQFAVYYNGEHDASNAMISCGGMNVMGTKMKFMGLVRLSSNPKLSEIVASKLDGVTMQVVDYATVSPDM